MLIRTALILSAFSLTAAGQGPGTSPSPTIKRAPHTPPKTVSLAAPAKPLVAILHTTAGDMKCELFTGQAPKTVANFTGLAQGTKRWKNPATGKQVVGKPLYDGVIFHRVIPNFMIQGGDPSGSGSGDVGFEFQDELRADLLFDKPGRLAMANHGPNTNSSQFFITEEAVPFLNPCLDEGGCTRGSRHVDKNTGYTIFGQCDDVTVELVKKIARMPCQGGAPCDGRNSRPQDPVKIKHVEIQNAGSRAAAQPSVAKPAAAKPAAQPKSSPTVPN
jgi:peptidyl-prolyl cis-trans isomerase A (cyclophilin A)